MADAPVQTVSGAAKTAEEELVLLRELVNMRSYAAPLIDGRYHVLFIGKNAIGERSAEMLNQMQIDGVLTPLGPRPKKAGFVAITIDDDDRESLKDLQEATNGTARSTRLLTAPRQAPVVWIVKAPLKRGAKESKESGHRDTQFANDSGFIGNPHGSWADRWK